MLWELVKQNQPTFCPYLNTGNKNRRENNHFTKKRKVCVSENFSGCVGSHKIVSWHHLQIEKHGRTSKRHLSCLHQDKSYGALPKDYNPIKFSYGAVSVLWKALQVTNGPEWGRNISKLWTWKEAQTQMVVIPGGDTHLRMWVLRARQKDCSVGFSCYCCRAAHKFVSIGTLFIWLPLTFISIVISKMFCPVPERIPTVVLIRIAFANYVPTVPSPLTVSLKVTPFTLGFPCSCDLQSRLTARCSYLPLERVLICFQVVHTWPYYMPLLNLWGSSSWVNDHFPPWEVLLS